MLELRRLCARERAALFTLYSKYVAVGPNPEGCACVYRELVSEALPDTLVQPIRMYLQQQKILETDRFYSWLAARTGEFAEVRPIGRWPRTANCP